MAITAEEKNFLEGIFRKKKDNNQGTYPGRVEGFQELTANEQRFFDKNNFVSSNFSVQTLYKFSGQIVPLRFNLSVHNMMVADETFRTNYYPVGTKTIKVIFDKNTPIPEVTYRNLQNYEGEDLDDMITKIMEADRRLKFDLATGDLMRFTVLHTGEKEFAVLVTMSKLIADKFNAQSFFSSISTKSEYEPLVEQEQNLLVGYITDPVHDYWEKFLKDLPVFKEVPYTKRTAKDYNEKLYREQIPATIVSDLRIKAQDNRMMLMAIFQTAWGFLLQAVNKVDDTVFCQLTENSVKKSSSLNVIPIRLKCSDNETIDSIIKKQFRQIIVSQPYSFFDWESLRNLTNKRTLFDHFLSFLDFKAEQQSYTNTNATPTGKVVAKNSWDTCGMKLGIYFQYMNTDLSLTICYDANQFYPSVGTRFAKIYNTILKQMLNYWNADFSQFMDTLTKQLFEDLESQSETQKTEDRKLIVDFIATNKILQGEHSGTVQMLAESAELRTYFEGDRISGDIINSNLIFVVDGKVARSLDTGDGWYNALDIISKGGWLNETIFLDKRRSTIAGEVLTEQATILLIPMVNIDNVLRKFPSFYKNFMTHILKQMEKYQILWLQS